MDEDEQLAGGQRERRAERLALERERFATAPQLHLDGERVAALFQVVAEHTVEHGEQRLALRP
ncbi:MAG: hypothetical protein M5U28_33525 [Sandaracinaceae bacterium]|nr:hypothetical protein [Sandaracinaceae bacterium]